MACYAVLLSVVELLDDIILHHDIPHFRHMPKLVPIITSLYQKFSSLEESLRDYASKGDEAADSVEVRIRDAAYKAQHIIDLRISNQNMLEDVEEKTFHLLNEVDHKIEAIVEELAVIKGRQQKHDCSSPVHPSDKLPVSTTPMVGFDGYLTTIRDQLYRYSGPRQVISIVGTGGIGKTTLARNIFDDDRHFDCRAWITVSQEYNAQQVLQSLIKSLGVKESRESNERLSIYQHLNGRRYLIVLDDMWDTKVWEDVMHIFPNDDDNGSRIVLTTRSLHIAQYAGTSSDFIHQIQFLNKDDSWELFQSNVFAQNGCSLDLEDIGKSIVSKCGGLPLAIVVIAGILSNDKTLSSWEEIETNMGAILNRSNEQVFSMLSFSYNHLPHQLKACFLYMGIFPEDYRINVSNLIKLWVAEGFLKSTNGSKTLEEVGEECLENLVGRNLVIVTKRRPNGQFKYCVLHDLLRDLCRERAVDECFFHVSYDGRNDFNPRRMNFYYGHPFQADDNVVHSVHYFRDEFNSDFVGRMDILKHLRVLNVDTKWKDFSVGDLDTSRMFCLKFLKFGDIELPPSILMSYSLHTIIIDNGYHMRLPPEIWKMTQLRHLIITRMTLQPIPMVGGDVPIQKLGCLQTLMKLQDFRFTKEVIEMIPNLRQLGIEYLSEECGIWESYGLDNLVDLHHLEELKILFYFDLVTSPLRFALPHNLKELSLSGCNLPWNLMKVVGLLSNLQVIRLLRDAFVGEVWEPIEGEFKSLKYLKLAVLLNLKRWQAKASHFPRLERLKIISCMNLEEIPLAIGDIGTLKYIKVSNSSKSVGASAIRIQEDQLELENDAFQVEVWGCHL